MNGSTTVFSDLDVPNGLRLFATQNLPTVLIVKAANANARTGKSDIRLLVCMEVFRLPTSTSVMWMQSQPTIDVHYNCIKTTVGYSRTQRRT
eukprot:scaffold32194_cov32-Attheya_sp.AAC.1